MIKNDFMNDRLKEILGNIIGVILAVIVLPISQWYTIGFVATLFYLSNKHLSFNFIDLISSAWWPIYWIGQIIRRLILGL